jgi:hypothetical protein
MTKSQRLVLVWLKERCSHSGVIRVSNQEVAQAFGWSQVHGKRILNSLVEQGHLEELQKGIGRRATKYRVSASHTPFRSSHNQLATTKNRKQPGQQVPSHTPKRFAPFRYINTPRNIQGENAQTIAHVQNIFDSVSIRVKKPVATNSSPFKRFQRHWSRVEIWAATDFVCYYSFVYRVRFGTTPVIQWAKECGAARILLKRIGDPIAFKAFLQIAFAISKRPPKGLHTFSWGDFYEEVIDREVDEAILDEYDDEYVYPWLKQEMIRRSREAAAEYNRSQIRRALGIYN